MKFDTSENGLQTLFKQYQAALLEHIWELNDPDRTGITSGQAYKFLQDHPDSKSRASVIIFLNDMVEEGVLSYEERTKRGGPYKVYLPEMSREEFEIYIVKSIITKLEEVFPSIKGM